MITFETGSCMVSMHVPDDPCSRIVYLHASPEEGMAVWQQLSEPKPVLAVISGTDWNRDFSPWPAPKVFARGDDFSGGGEAHLAHLAEKIIPEAERALPCTVSSRCIAGYSLAGLFALWCVCKTDLFDASAALSPSLWFDGFETFMDENAPSKNTKVVIMSLGDREKHTRNPRMACIENAALKVSERLRTYGLNVHFTFERGGHFDDPIGRIARGINNLAFFT